MSFAMVWVMLGPQLAIVVGVAVISLGVSGIPVMRRYWERVADRAESESHAIRQEAQGAKERIKQRAQARKDQLRRTETIVTSETERPAARQVTLNEPERTSRTAR